MRLHHSSSSFFPGSPLSLISKAVIINRWCSGLKRFGAHRFMCLNGWPMGNGMIRKYSLVGVGVALFEEVCYCEHVLWSSLCLGSAQWWWQSPPAASRLRCRTLSSFSSIMPTCMLPAMPPAMMIMDWTSETVSQPRSSVFSYKSFLSHDVSSLAIQS